MDGRWITLPYSSWDWVSKFGVTGIKFEEVNQARVQKNLLCDCAASSKLRKRASLVLPRLT